MSGLSLYGSRSQLKGYRMMREHKYQAWHKAQQKMYRVVTLYLGKKEQSVTLRPLTDDSSLFSFLTRSMDEVELREFTGIVDKNGKEIYEGDIVGYPDDEVLPEALMHYRGIV